MSASDEPTARDFARAFLAIGERVTPKQRTIIEAHLAAPEHTATARELAEAIGYDSHRPVNSQYGRLAAMVGEALDIQVDVKLDLLTEVNRTPGRELALTLKPAVIAALETIGWRADAPSLTKLTRRFDAVALEGGMREVLVFDRERDRSIRRLKIEEAIRASVDGRLRCEVPGCGFDFEAAYGSLGRGFIHVHHRRSLAAREGAEPTCLADLALVCANCHAMIHRGGECRELHELVANGEA